MRKMKTDVILQYHKKGPFHLAHILVWGIGEKGIPPVTPLTLLSHIIIFQSRIH